MGEPAGFEARAVLAPRRTRLTRLTLLVPVVALVATAWVGLNGERRDQATAEVVDPSAIAAPSPASPRSTPAAVPAQVIGLQVLGLDMVPTMSLGSGAIVAVAGWYVATATTDCPPVVVIYRLGALPEIRADADLSTYCVRSGVLYGSQPDALGSGSARPGLAAIGVTFVKGVIAPPALEVPNTTPTQVVVIGRFVRFTDGCPVPAVCPTELVVDHVAWTPGA